MLVYSTTKKGIVVQDNGVVEQSAIYDPTITDDQIIDIGANGIGSFSKGGESLHMDILYQNVVNVTNSQATLTVSGYGNGIFRHVGEYNASFDSTTVTLTGDSSNVLPPLLHHLHLHLQHHLMMFFAVVILMNRLFNL